jgi:hypothetical protein|tara:strand:- start:171 stop:1289 length:1119 start_codon:yes stop_codon:yes gene_type:complete
MSTEEKIGEDKADLKVKLKKPNLMKKDKGPIKVDLTKKQEDAVQEQTTDEVLVRDESTVSEEVPQENVEKTDEQPTEESKEEVIIEAVEEEKETFKPKFNVPENLHKLVNFMNDTGGTLEDYVRLNTNYEDVDNDALLVEYYKTTKPHLDKEEIEFLIEDKFSYDEDSDEEREIKKKRLAAKEELAKARLFFEDTKKKYYDEIKLRSNVNPDQQKAMDFFNRYNKEQEIATERHSRFEKSTEELFTDFKGFDINVGDKNFKYKITNAIDTGKRQSNLNTFVKKFLNKEGEVVDTAGYHKAIYAAENIDAIAKNFYEQGKADATKEIMAKSKNIDVEPRAAASGDVFIKGLRVKAISGADSSRLKFKKINKTT